MAATPNTTAEKVADDIMLGPYELAKKAVKAVAGRKKKDGTMQGSSSSDVGGGTGGSIAIASITPLLGLISIILIIVFGVKLAKLAATRGLQGAQGKHLVSLGIAAPALMGVPFVNLGMAVWLAVAVNGAANGGAQ